MSHCDTFSYVNQNSKRRTTVPEVFLARACRVGSSLFYLLASSRAPVIPMSTEEHLASMVTYRRFNIKSGKKLTLRNIEEVFSVGLCVWYTASFFIAFNFIIPVIRRAPSCLPTRAARTRQRASMEESQWNDDSTTLRQLFKIIYGWKHCIVNALVRF